jgi:hypothetical protein
MAYDLPIGCSEIDELWQHCKGYRFVKFTVMNVLVPGIQQIKPPLQGTRLNQAQIIYEYVFPLSLTVLRGRIRYICQNGLHASKETVQEPCSAS